MRSSLIPFGTTTPRLFDEFRREIDELMDRFLSEPTDGATASWFSPTINVAETDNEYEVTCDLPGMKPEDIDVELKNGELWVTGERKHEDEQREKSWHRVERQYGRFQRMIRLGEDVDPERIEAEYRDGVLRITVAKTEASQPKRIAIKS